MGFYDSFGKKHLIAAHRGWRTIRPENTLSAFERAVGHFDLIELDIQLSRDREWIVCHNGTLERTSDVESRFPGQLRPRRVIDYSLGELRTLDAGQWFLDRDPFGTLASDEVSRKEIEALLPQRLPTLREVLRFSKAAAVPLNIEIKDMPTVSEEEVVTCFLESAGEALQDQRILVSSFNHRYLSLLHRKRSTLSLAVLVKEVHPPNMETYLKDLGVEAYHIDLSLTASTPVEKLAEQRISCAVYTVNDSGERQRLYRRGFRMVFADRPMENS